MSTIDSASMLDSLIRLVRIYRRAVATTFVDLTNGRQASILRELRASEGISQVALSRAIAVDPSLIVRALDSLEEQGLVSRKRSSTNRREMVLGLTEAGRQALEPIDDKFEHLTKTAFEELSLAEQKSFVELATRIHRSLTKLIEGSEKQNG